MWNIINNPCIIKYVCVFLANCWTCLRGVGHSWFIRWGAHESRLSSRCHHGMSRVHNGNEAILTIIILSQWKCQLFLGEIFSSPKVDGVEVCRKNCLSKFCCGVYDPSWKSVQSIRWQSSIGPNGSNRIYPAFSALAIFLLPIFFIFLAMKVFSFMIFLFLLSHLLLVTIIFWPLQCRIHWCIFKSCKMPKVSKVIFLYYEAFEYDFFGK